MPWDSLSAQEHQGAQPSVVCKGPTWGSRGQGVIPAFNLLINEVNQYLCLLPAAVSPLRLSCPCKK